MYQTDIYYEGNFFKFIQFEISYLGYNLQKMQESIYYYKIDLIILSVILLNKQILGIL